MNPRELVILLLGFAIIAVILRGLYVALQARHGQIRLAIDKNIPRDIDLEALEMAELPGGGARVVARSLAEVNSQNTAIDAATRRAEKLNLGDSDQPEVIPLLMDAVELSLQPGRGETTSVPAASAKESGIFARDADESSQGDSDEDPDSVLFDYENHGLTDREIAVSSFEDDWEDAWEEGEEGEEGEELTAVGVDDEDLDEYGESANYRGTSRRLAEDRMASVMPDYPAENNAENAADNFCDDELNQEHDEGDADDDYGDGEEDRTEPSLNADSQFDSGWDQFSMTAGERIGFNTADPAGGPREMQQKAEQKAQRAVHLEALQDEYQDELFDEPEEKERDKPQRRSLFAAFSRKRELPPEQSVESARQDASVVRIEDNAMKQEAKQEGKREESFATEAAPPREMPTQPSEVIVINVMAKAGRSFSGDDLMQVLITAGLKFGEMNIFHKRYGNDSRAPVIFSVANVLNPGTFDLNNMENFSTLGISLFLAMPAAIHNMDAFEQMLAVAQRVRGALDGELRDDHRNVMTAQTIEHYRQRISDFELRRLKSVGSRG
ncbi:MAG: cell division protein ZipA [Proteobacteria bacterium]|nr:cell division protein ZipA [Pseudomonadota bacterium]